MKHLPGYRITHVGHSVEYARCLTDIPDISFSLSRFGLASPSGRRFLRDMSHLGISVYMWTVNDESWMEWSIRSLLTGVITDDVVLFHEVCNRMDNGDGQTQTATQNVRGVTSPYPWLLYRTARFWCQVVLFHILLSIFMAKERLRHGPLKYRISKALNE